MTVERQLFGIETEMALAAVGSFGVAWDKEAVIKNLLALAQREFPCLPGHGSSGLFLGNGGRFYLDSGQHPEYATPECDNPWDAVRYLRAGEAIVDRLARSYARSVPEADMNVSLFRCNVDYSGVSTTWGMHQSFMHHADHNHLSLQIIPHLVSRIIYTGAGGFDTVQTGGLRFTLSPRALFMARDVSGSSTGGRGIFHTKDETLSNRPGEHRLHIILNENLCSDLALWLSVGATALIIRMIDNGLSPAGELALRDPVSALRAIASDPFCRVEVHDVRDRKWRALDIQRHYLDFVWSQRQAPFFPTWGEEVCRRWRDVLNRIEQGAPASVSTMLDWANKYMIFQDRLHRADLDLERMAGFNEVIDHWKNHFVQVKLLGNNFTPEELIDPNCAAADGLMQWVAQRTGQVINRKRLAGLLQQRTQLFEIDMRYGQIGEEGLFSRMLRAGVLETAVPGVDNVDHAMREPPNYPGRAGLRGRAIQRLHGWDGCTAEWNGIWNETTGKFLDLTDPLQAAEAWLPLFQGQIKLSSVPTMNSPEGIRVGERVILGRHTAVSGLFNWNMMMDPYVGKLAIVQTLLGPDRSGSFMALVDVDGGRFQWRTRDMSRATPARA